MKIDDKLGVDGLRSRPTALVFDFENNTRTHGTVRGNRQEIALSLLLSREIDFEFWL